MTAEEKLLDNGYEGVKCFSNFSYDDALIGVTTDDRAVYSYSKMLDWLIEKEGFTYEEAEDWIDYNTIRALPYGGADGPIIMYDLIE